MKKQSGLVAFADGDRNQQRSADEINLYNAELTQFFNQKIQLTNAKNTPGELSLQPLAADHLPASVHSSSGTLWRLTC
jgi:hypothetical protein